MFDNNRRYCRGELEMTQAELGYIFGVSDSAVRSWETAHDSIPLPKLIKFCNMYDYSLDFVCGLIRNNIKYGKSNCYNIFCTLSFLLQLISYKKA